MHPLAHAGPGPALSIVGTHHDALTDGPHQDVPLFVMLHLLTRIWRVRRPDSIHACHGPARRGDLRRRGVCAREIALRPLVQPRALSRSPLEDVHDP